MNAADIPQDSDRLATLTMSKQILTEQRLKYVALSVDGSGSHIPIQRCQRPRRYVFVGILPAKSINQRNTDSPPAHGSRQFHLMILSGELLAGSQRRATTRPLHKSTIHILDPFQHHNSGHFRRFW